MITTGTTSMEIPSPLVSPFTAYSRSDYMYHAYFVFHANSLSIENSYLTVTPNREIVEPTSLIVLQHTDIEGCYVIDVACPFFEYAEGTDDFVEYTVSGRLESIIGLKHLDINFTFKQDGCLNYNLPPVTPEDEEIVIKRYLLVDSSRHESYEYEKTNIYPLTEKEAFINVSGETYEFNGNSYYIWHSWFERNGQSFEEKSVFGDICLLTTSLDVTLPLTSDSDDFGYIIGIDDYETGDITEYISHIALAQVNEYDTGKREERVADIKTRLYNYNHTLYTQHYMGEQVVQDYFMYSGEKTEFNGQKCFVFYQYDNECLPENCQDDFLEGYVERSGIIKAILLNTLYVKSFPFNRNSQEFVAAINFNDEIYDGDWESAIAKHSDYNTGLELSTEDKMANGANRIEYFPEEDYSIKNRYLVFPPYYRDDNILNEYHSSKTLSINNSFVNTERETIEYNGEQWYLWNCYQEIDGEKTQDYFHEKNIKLLTKTLSPILPLDTKASEDCVLLVGGDEEKNHYLGDYKCVARVDEYYDGRIKRVVAEEHLRINVYCYSDTLDLFGENYAQTNAADYTQLRDYYVYRGETIEWNGEKCYIFMRYNDGHVVNDGNMVDNSGADNDTSKAILLNTLWIDNLPITENSPEYVATINFDDEVYDGDMNHIRHGDETLDRITYLPIFKGVKPPKKEK